MWKSTSFILPCDAGYNNFEWKQQDKCDGAWLKVIDTRHLEIRVWIVMAFLQDSPQLPHPYRSDRALLALLDRVPPTERRAAMDADLDTLGDYARQRGPPSDA